MLPVEQIIPFIRHEDPFVVDLAMRCLEWVRWPQRLTGDFVLDAVRDGHPQLVRWLDHFTPTAAVLDYAIESLAGRKPGSDTFWPNGVMARAPDGLFTPGVIEAVRRLQFDYPWVAEQTRWRLEMLARPTERLRERLLEACTIANDEWLAQSEQHEAASLVDRLAYRGDSVEWALDRLRDHMGSNGWAEIWLFILLVKSRYRPTLDLILSRWPSTNPDDNEALTNEFSFAVSELATAADLPAVAGLWNDPQGESNRSHLIEAVGRLRIPEAEGVVLDFARRTDDLATRTYAGIGLCEMLCTGDESLQFLRDMVDREEFDTTQLALEEPASHWASSSAGPSPKRHAGANGLRTRRRTRRAELASAISLAPRRRR